MNYRHAFHAGGAADCLKHALLVAMLGLMQRKPAAIAVLDTHAGAGPTPLDGQEAERTGEWRGGIGRLEEAGATAPPLQTFLELARRLGLSTARTYPGSAGFAQAMLRPQDRLIACELEPAAADALRARLAPDPRCAVHRRDGYEAIGGLLPPSGGIRRALVLIDPPFERPGEFERLAAAIARATARLAGAAVAAWYPIKHRAPVRAFHDGLRAASPTGDLVALELLLAPPHDPTRLAGSGLVVARPPWGLLDLARPLLAELALRLGGPAATFSIAPLSAR